MPGHLGPVSATKGHFRARARQDRGREGQGHADGWSGAAGYRVGDIKLVVVEDEANTVRLIMERYLKIRSVPALITALSNHAIVTKVKTMRDGSTRGGVSFTRGPIYRLLKDRIFRGQIVQKDTVYLGEHQAIIHHELFDQVQQVLPDSAGDKRRRPRVQRTSLVRTTPVPRVSVTQSNNNLGREIGPRDIGPSS